MKTVRSSLSETTHETLVRRAAVHLRQHMQPDVRADLPDGVRPDRIVWTKTQQGHIPDVTGGQYIIEVETSETLAIEHTREQCMLFSVFAREQQKKIFVVVVPMGYQTTMELQLRAWGIVWEVWQM